MECFPTVVISWLVLGLIGIVVYVGVSAAFEVLQLSLAKEVRRRPYFGLGSAITDLARQVIADAELYDPAKHTADEVDSLKLRLEFLEQKVHELTLANAKKPNKGKK